MEQQYESLFKLLSAGEYPAGYDKSQKFQLKRTAKKFTLKGGQLFHKQRRVVKTPEQAMQIFKEFHVSPLGGHSGVSKTISAIALQFYWKGLTVHVTRWVKECEKCQKAGRPLAATRPSQCIKVSEVWELVGIELAGPFPQTVDGFKYILTATDYFSKWVEAFPLKTKSVVEVARHLCSLIFRHGCPKQILSDQGSEFVNKLNDWMCKLLSIERIVTASYHPQTNGLDEKTNHTIKRALAKLVNDQQDDWDVYLEGTLFSIRSKMQTTTKRSPFCLMYGREAVFPTQIPVEVPLSNIILPTEGELTMFMAEKKSEMEKVKEKTIKNRAKSQEGFCLPLDQHCTQEAEPFDPISSALKGLMQHH